MIGSSFGNGLGLGGFSFGSWIAVSILLRIGLVFSILLQDLDLGGFRLLR